MTTMSTDVVISGAGPNGLMLARELALAGVRPVVLDLLGEPSLEPKANGLVGQVIRTLDMRGLYHRFGGAPGAPTESPAWTFSGIPVSFTELADNPMYALLISQPQLVAALHDSVRELGVDVRWGHELTGLCQRDGAVTVAVTAPGGDYELDTRYLVGADGGRSVVRKRAGIGFPGHTMDMVARLAHVRLPDHLRVADGYEVPGYGRLPFGHSRLGGGGLVFASFEPSRSMIGTLEYGVGPVREDEPMTLGELKESLYRVVGVDIPIETPPGPGPHALRRINGQNTRQADRYREGDIFLVGDAAHVQSAMGGPGLNLGLQDAVNLGWKLAADVNGWAPAGLLDTYQQERYPVGERVMMQSMSQTALMAPGPEVTALRGLFGELVRDRDTAGRIAGLLAGSDVRYELGDDHPLSGLLFPDLELPGGGRVAELLHDGRARLVDFGAAGDGGYRSVVDPWRDRVTVTTVAAECAPAALLIRPDGYVAWAADAVSPVDAQRLRAALRRWFGAPADFVTPG